ncbi:MAG: DNA-processing protein DprA [Oscillospiraceae bacterium]|nr:DNA-processing protein DprA [Oscillospiraceae bacterium]
MAELRYWVWLATRRGLGARTAFELLNHFGSPEEIFFADKPKLSAVLPVNSPLLSDSSPLFDHDLDEARAIVRYCTEKRISILTYPDGAYPARLKNIYDPPLVLYVYGRLPELDDEAVVAVVGTRECSATGLTNAERISYEIAKMGGIIVSGLARGIDSAAARGAIRAGGKVIGVLGSGVDVVYPQSNRALFGDIYRTGALISEYPPQTKPEKSHFPARNRIMSGISMGVLVVEAPEKSGALITAARALEQGRDVFAVPGSLDNRLAAGSNALLKEGAQVVTCGRDIMELYEAYYPEKVRMAPRLTELDERGKRMMVERELAAVQQQEKAAPVSREPAKNTVDKKKPEDYIEISQALEDLSPEELQVLKSIDKRSMHVDDIIARSGMEPALVLSCLTMLEISGAVTQEAGKRFTARIIIK